MLKRLPAKMTQQQARDELAKRYGFESFAVLLDISTLLPSEEGETFPCYLAYGTEKRWFLWRDDTQPDSEGTADR
jgi:hypothetical protein